MRLLTTSSFLIIWTLYFLLGECRPYGLLEHRAPRYTKGNKITIKVKSTIMVHPKIKNTNWAIAKSSKPVESGRETMDQGIPFDEEVAALEDIDMKGLRHEDPMADNFLSPRTWTNDYGRSRRVPGMDAKLKNNIEYDSVKGFNPLSAVCDKKPSAPGRLFRH
ncbi:uncharacterized protein ARMOST_05708 [Armillaria ostoyae]|uniref:Uncharacterized protein n=1 Tax=Armillaria ostoyae TaxID=47428 RepID=A0A284R0Z2_ARMOS|nr:uncharacterized protein ARMOST_05708 [Armillaria ostoyae]